MNDLSFAFLTVPKIVFGRGKIGVVGESAAAFGKRPLLVCGKSWLRGSGHLKTIQDSISRQRMDLSILEGVPPEPSLEDVERAIAAVREHRADVVIGIGGGSVIDVAKAAAALSDKPEPLEEFFRGRRVERPGTPLVAVPTTAGSGAEATINSVLIDRKARAKQSIRGEAMLARAVIADPELTLGLPPRWTAYSGMDALTQAIEAFVSVGATPVSDSLAREAIRLIAENLLVAYRNGLDIEARSGLLLGSLMTGIAFTNSRLGAVHGLAHSVGVFYSQPHGLVCSVLLPYVMEFNAHAASDKYAEIADILGAGERSAGGAIAMIKGLLKSMEIPDKLGTLGLRQIDINDIIRASMPSGSLKTNPRKASEDDLRAILAGNL